MLMDHGACTYIQIYIFMLNNRDLNFRMGFLELGLVVAL